MSARSIIGMEQHPDIAALRANYDLAAETAPAQLSAGLTFLAGLYLAISPWVIGFSSAQVSLTTNNLITGIALAALAVGFASAYGRTHGVAWVAPLIGVWTIVSPWVINGDAAKTDTIWNNVVTGAVAVVFGAAATAVGIAMARR
jgi:hypothetical protein